MDFEMTNPMSSDPRHDNARHPETPPNKRLWFEFAASVFAWLSLGSLDCVVAWRACVHQEQFGGASYHPGARVLYFVLWIALFGIAFLSGSMAYRTWRRLSDASGLLSAEGRERREFMSLCGLFITLTLGCGFFWMCLPLFILQMCLRAR
ncbi:MAG: hypothetical protein HIU91_00875 [Acidobacteria bacterium]|nr:hypothetical protein [Acidobacteriota bacterium]